MASSLSFIFRIFSIGMVCPIIIASDYYEESSLDRNQIDAEGICKDRGSYLASIHSTSQYEQVMHACQLTPSTCWIGLEIVKNTQYQWTDGTSVDTTFIQEHLCDESPIKSENITYYTYINNTSNCWGSSSSNSIIMNFICGPQMFAPDGIYYWICTVIIPFVLVVSGCVYAFCIFVSLMFNLYKKEHNWLPEIKPTKSTRCTAISLPLIASIIFALVCVYYTVFITEYNKTGIFPPPDLINDHYSGMYVFSGYCLGISGVLYLITITISYIHMLLRLKNSFDNNEFMKTVISPKCFYPFMFTLIALYSAMPLMYALINRTLHYYDGRKLIVQAVIISTWVTVDLIINLALLISYIKGLHSFSMKYYSTPNEYINTINSRQDELLIEATRYTVLFGIVSILDIIVFLGVIILSIIIPAGDISKNLLSELAVYIKEMVLLTAIYLSFRFSHTKYEKKYCCYYCDKRMKSYYRNRAKKKKKELEQDLLYEYDVNL